MIHDLHHNKLLSCGITYDNINTLHRHIYISIIFLTKVVCSFYCFPAWSSRKALPNFMTSFLVHAKVIIIHINSQLRGGMHN